MDNTITEHDMDPAAQQLVQGLRDSADNEPDLAIDGLSESVFGKLLNVFRIGRS